MKPTGLAAVVITIVLAAAACAKPADYLKIGQFRPAFDHLGNMGNQIDAVAASGCTVNYGTIGSFVYDGLPAKGELQKLLQDARACVKRGHSQGVPVMLSYLCATSLVNADRFTANWKDHPELPVDADPQTLLQQDLSGNNLPSWYGAPYNPADTWNPVWRQYHKFLIKLVVQCGYDGVFYDNPTVHVNGNYSQYAMRAWSKFLRKNGVRVPNEGIQSLRELTKSNQRLWLEFRATEVADFLREMRDYGRSLKPGFILTANNSLNSWDSFYSQPRSMGYSIFNQSQSQDFITVEDMSMSPRRDGSSYVSYASTIRMIHSIGDQRPISVSTIANGSYTTPPNMMKLATAECAANDAAYMVWACWDEKYRQSNAAAVKQYHVFMDKHPDLFAESKPLSEGVLIWPYENWPTRDDCPTAGVARELSAGNLQYDVVTENDLTPAKLSQYGWAMSALGEGPLKPDTQKMLTAFTRSGGRVSGAPDASVVVTNAPGVRASVRRTKSSLFLHLYNLNVVREDDYHDRVEPAKGVSVSWLLPKGFRLASAKLQCLTPDAEGYSGELSYTRASEGDRTRISFVIPRLQIWSVIRAGMDK